MPRHIHYFCLFWLGNCVFWNKFLKQNFWKRHNLIPDFGTLWEVRLTQQLLSYQTSTSVKLPNSRSGFICPKEEACLWATDVSCANDSCPINNHPSNPSMVWVSGWNPRPYLVACWGLYGKDSRPLLTRLPDASSHIQLVGIIGVLHGGILNMKITHTFSASARFIMQL